jgi:hypothetical protein
MSLSKVYTNWPVTLDADTAQSGTPVYVNVQSLSLNNELQTALARASGDLYASYGFLRRGDPAADFTSFDLKEFFDAVGIEEMLIDSGASGDGVKLFFQKMDKGGTRKSHSSGEHMSTTIGDGVLYGTTVELPAGGDGQVTARIIALSSDGSTHPLSFSESASLPSGVNPQVDAMYTAGKVDLNGTELDGKQSVTINLGPNPTSARHADSDIYPTHVSMESFAPTIEIITQHIDITSTLDEAGSYYGAGNVVVYARKRSEGGALVDAATAEHMSFTMGKCRIEVSSIDTDPKQARILCTPWDTPGGVAQIAINTATAIS